MSISKKKKELHQHNLNKGIVRDLMNEIEEEKKKAAKKDLEKQHWFVKSVTVWIVVLIALEAYMVYEALANHRDYAEAAGLFVVAYAFIMAAIGTIMIDKKVTENRFFTWGTALGAISAAVLAIIELWKAK